MNCEQAQALLAAYSAKEASPSERVLLQAHLAGCGVCQAKLSQLANLEGQLRSVLQHRAAAVAPSANAWARLEGRLAPAAPAAKHLGGPARQAPSASSPFTRLFSGDQTMRKRFMPLAGLAIVAVAAAGIFMFKSVPPVSAQTILQRSYEAQSQQPPTQGIQHLQYQTFFNDAGQLSGTTSDTYLDLGSCNSRTVTRNSQTGTLLSVFAIDGPSVYSGYGDDIHSTQPLTVYKSPAADVKDGGACARPSTPDDSDTFNQMRGQANAALVGQETWPDGRKVYILDVPTPAQDGQKPAAGSHMKAYFDVATYQFLGAKEFGTSPDGQDVLIDGKLNTVNEFLPAGSLIHWDVSDLPGTHIVEDRDGTYRDQPKG